MSHTIKPGVAAGDEVQAIFKLAKEKGFALPAINVTSTSTVNAVLETAAKLNSPVIIQFSNGGAHYFAGKGLSNVAEKAAIAGGRFQVDPEKVANGLLDTVKDLIRSRKA